MARIGIIDRMVTSPINYWGGFVGNVVAIAFFLFYGMTRSQSSAAACLAAGLAGLALWTAIEYGMHRFIFHGPETAARRNHVRHHRQPQAIIGSPVLIVVSIAATLWLLLMNIVAADIASFIMAGVVVGYLYFAALHHLLHHWHGSARFFARSHLYHEIHHRRTGVNFGFTSAFWDRVFGTFDPGKPVNR